MTANHTPVDCSAAPAPSPRAADGAPSALGAGHTWPADGAPTGSVADRPAGSRNPALPAAGVAGRAALPRALALAGSERTSQSSEPFAAADDVSLVITDASASRPGWGSGRDVPQTFDAHVDRALTVGGFPVVDPLGPRLVEPAPLPDPALREPERVWIAVRRKGIDRHFVLRWPSLGAGVFTYCSRSIRTGELLPADDPWIAAHTRPCPRCWPGGVS